MIRIQIPTCSYCDASKQSEKTDNLQCFCDVFFPMLREIKLMESIRTKNNCTKGFCHDCYKEMEIRLQRKSHKNQQSV